MEELVCLYSASHKKQKQKLFFCDAQHKQTKPMKILSISTPQEKRITPYGRARATIASKNGVGSRKQWPREIYQRPPTLHYLGLIPLTGTASSILSGTQILNRRDNDTSSSNTVEGRGYTSVTWVPIIAGGSEGNVWESSNTVDRTKQPVDILNKNYRSMCLARLHACPAYMASVFMVVRVSFYYYLKHIETLRYCRISHFLTINESIFLFTCSSVYQYLYNKESINNMINSLFSRNGVGKAGPICLCWLERGVLASNILCWIFVFYFFQSLLFKLKALHSALPSHTWSYRHVNSVPP